MKCRNWNSPPPPTGGLNYQGVITIHYGRIFIHKSYNRDLWSTLFFKRNTTFLNPFFLVTLGHWPWPRVMYILSNGFESNSQKTPLQNSSRASRNPRLFLTKCTWLGVRVSDSGSPEKMGSEKLRFFWRRMYIFKLCTVDLPLPFHYSFLCFIHIHEEFWEYNTAYFLSKWDSSSPVPISLQKQSTKRHENSFFLIVLIMITNHIYIPRHTFC